MSKRPRILTQRTGSGRSNPVRRSMCRVARVTPSTSRRSVDREVKQGREEGSASAVHDDNLCEGKARKEQFRYASECAKWRGAETDTSELGAAPRSRSRCRLNGQRTRGWLSEGNGIGNARTPPRRTAF